LTRPPYQFVAYYDAERQMTVAQRKLDSEAWDFVKLPSRLGWDSHNGVTMALDRRDHLHVCGNMHCVPLVYFRSSQPLDAASLERVPNMIGVERERRVTYPVFLRGRSDELIFRYRDGSSGSGDDLYNVYDESTGQWRRLIDGPLLSGRGKMNAYCTRPALGPDDRYHMVWVWRDTPDCATNHDLSYARSRDLVVWETAGGQPLSLPITIDSPAVVDPVRPGDGLINGGHRLGFDPAGRPVIAYHKYDPQGDSQIFVARPAAGDWEVRQISRWKDYRWDFQGGGSIVFEVRVGAVRAVGEKHVRVECRSPRGQHVWWLSADDLQPASAPTPADPATTVAESAKEVPAAEPAPQAVPLAARPDFPGLIPRSRGDSGRRDEAAAYRLHWYTLGPNRDRPRPGPLPPPSLLQVGVYR
jgi:hypothetical protein